METGSKSGKRKLKTEMETQPLSCCSPSFLGIPGAYGKTGMKMKMETGNGKWKWKWERKMHRSLVQCFLHSVLSHYSCIELSNGYRTGFMSRALPLLLCDYCF